MAKTVSRSVASRSSSLANLSTVLTSVTPSTEAHGELEFLQLELKACFKKEQWDTLAELLDTVAKVGQGHAQRELCLKAQTLREVMANRSARLPGAVVSLHSSHPWQRMTELFDELICQLSHLQWKVGNETTH